MTQETVPLRSEEGEPLPLCIEYCAWRISGGAARLWLVSAIEAVLDPAAPGGEAALPWWLAMTVEERRVAVAQLPMFARAMASMRALEEALAELGAISDALGAPES